MKGFWIKVNFKGGVLGELSRDGLIYRFKDSKEVRKAFKLGNLPHNESGFYFNSSKDRYCVEIEDEFLLVNPSWVYSCLGESRKENE